MTKQIGPSFSAELGAAGLLGKPFTWGADGVFHFDASMSQADIDAVQAVYAAHDPTKLQYKSEAIVALAATDVTMTRISEAVALGLTSWTSADVVAFVNYRRTLRAIMDGTNVGPLPAKPAYPAGT